MEGREDSAKSSGLEATKAVTDDSFAFDKGVIWYDIQSTAKNYGGTSADQNIKNVHSDKSVPWMSNMYANEDAGLQKNYDWMNAEVKNEYANDDRHAWPSMRCEEGRPSWMDPLKNEYKDSVKNDSNDVGVKTDDVTANIIDYVEKAVDWMQSAVGQTYKDIATHELNNPNVEKALVDGFSLPERYGAEDGSNINNATTSVNESTNIEKDPITTEMDGTKDGMVTVKTEPVDGEDRSPSSPYREEITVEVTLLEGVDDQFEPPTVPVHMEYSPTMMTYRDPASADSGEGTSEDRPHKCDLCPKSFSRNFNLKVHRRIHTIDTEIRKSNFPCTICNRGFAQKSHLHVHMAVHTGDKPYVCEVCNKSFTQKSTLNVHKRIHTGEKPFQCYICNKSFACKSNFYVHARTHSDEGPIKRKRYRCGFCSKFFTHKSDIDTHMEEHIDQKPYLCNVCNKPFLKKTGLNVHMKKHRGDKPFKCIICGIDFQLKSHLNRHLAMHTGEKAYQCSMCDKRFMDRFHLNRHMGIHDGEKKYQCDVCKKGFQQKSTLNSHMRVHTGEKAFPCEVCKKNFSCKSALKLHFRLHTGEKPYRCNLCNISWVRRSDMVKHTQAHPGIDLSTWSCPSVEVPLVEAK